MTPQEKAEELYNNFQQYDWDECDGYQPDSFQTVQTALKVVFEIQRQAENWGVYSVKRYWEEVIVELEKMY